MSGVEIKAYGATGIQQATVSQLLSRKRNFTPAHARALGGFFGVNPETFL